MGQLPQYAIAEDRLAIVISTLNERGFHAVCSQAKDLIAGSKTFYREWLITDEGGLKVVMWDEHDEDRDFDDLTVYVTVGTPNGRAGRELLDRVESILIELGASKSP